MLPHHAKRAKQHPVHHDGQYGGQPNGHPHPEVAESEDAFIRPGKPGDESEQRDEEGQVDPGKGIESQQTIEKHLATGNGFGQHEMHGPRGHLVPDKPSGHEERYEDSNQKHHAEFSDGQHETAVDGFEGVGFVIRVFVHVSIGGNHVGPGIPTVG